MIIATIAIIIIIIIIKQRVKRYSKPSTLFEHYRQQLLLLLPLPFQQVLHSSSIDIAFAFAIVVRRLRVRHLLRASIETSTRWD